MNGELISVIVPIYNKEATIKRCIDSILKQSYTNLEVIIVDDGSEDDSLSFANNYLTLDSRVRVLSKCNGGVSSARNLALNYVSGKYITFVDSDDWIESDFIEELYRVAMDTDADIVASNFIFDGKNDQTVNRSKNDTVVYFNKTMVCHEIAKVYDRKIGWENCSKLFKYEQIKQVKYDEDITNGEDWLYFCRVLERSRTIVVAPIYGYHYVFYQDSASNEIRKTYISACVASERVLSLDLPFTAVDRILIKESIAQSAMRCVYNWKRQNKNCNEKEMRNAQHYIKKYGKNVFRAKGSSLKRKAGFAIRYAYLKIFNGDNDVK